MLLPFSSTHTDAYKSFHGRILIIRIEVSIPLCTKSDRKIRHFPSNSDWKNTVESRRRRRVDEVVLRKKGRFHD